jgi:Xaa-Pro aminopeptidase
MSHAPSAALEQRHAAIREALRARELEAFLITSLPNVLYLTNFDGSAAVLVVTPDRLQFITDSRYVTALDATRGAAHECPGLELLMVGGSYDALIAETLTALSARRIGFEAGHLTVSRHTGLAAALARESALAKELVATDGIVEHARVRKDEYEIATLREAGRRLSAVAREVLGGLEAGQTEREVAMAIDWRIRRAGFSRPAFDTIVAAGPNAALPHARPGERKLAERDLVVLDFGGVYDSYCVDLTRTVSVGQPSERARVVHSAVREAHDRAIEMVQPGRSRFDIDAAARDTLTRHGLGDAFGHGTGHGLGIEIHEEPRIARRRPDVDARDEAVQPGMVFTIEPGAYLPDWGGVRIEDDVLVTADGVEVLTDVTTELIAI